MRWRRRPACGSTSATWRPSRARPAPISAAAHLDALFDHVGDGLIDYALLNGNHSARRPEGWLGEPVEVDERRLEELPVTVIEEDLVDVTNAHRHDSAKLAAALMRLQQEERVGAGAPPTSSPPHRLGRLTGRCWSPPS